VFTSSAGRWRLVGLIHVEKKKLLSVVLFLVLNGVKEMKKRKVKSEHVLEKRLRVLLLPRSFPQARGVSHMPGRWLCLSFAEDGLAAASFPPVPPAWGWPAK